MLHHLRQQLQQESPELFTFFERSEAIAEEQWFPAIGTNRGSFNSYPHVRNLENYLDLLLRDVEELPDRRRPFIFRMNTLEKYIMLSAILFHDIGRTHSEADCHAAESRDIVITRHAELGIPNRQIAYTLARICYSHDPEPENWEIAQGALQETVIDPYGLVRERPLATLLYLVDHLDSAFTRTIPYYLPGKKAETRALLRGNINGIRVDLKNQMIVVSIPNREPTIYNPTETDLQEAHAALRGIEGNAQFKINEAALDDIKAIPGLRVEAMIAYYYRDLVRTLKKSEDILLAKKKRHESNKTESSEVTKEIRAFTNAAPGYIESVITHLSLDLALQTASERLDAFRIQMLAAFSKDFDQFKRNNESKKEKRTRQFAQKLETLIAEAPEDIQKTIKETITETGKNGKPLQETVVAWFTDCVSAIIEQRIEDAARFRSKSEQVALFNIDGMQQKIRRFAQALTENYRAEKNKFIRSYQNPSIDTLRIQEEPKKFDVLCKTFLVSKNNSGSKDKNIGSSSSKTLDVVSFYKHISQQLKDANKKGKLIDKLREFSKQDKILKTPIQSVNISKQFSRASKKIAQLPKLSCELCVPPPFTIDVILKYLLSVPYLANYNFYVKTGVHRDTFGALNKTFKQTKSVVRLLQTGQRKCRKRAHLIHNPNLEGFVECLLAHIDSIFSKIQEPSGIRLKYERGSGAILLKPIPHSHNTKEFGKAYSSSFETDFLVDGYVVYPRRDLQQHRAENEHLRRNWTDPSYELLRAADLLGLLKDRQQVHSCALVYYLLSRGYLLCTNGASLLPQNETETTGLSSELKAMIIPIIVGNARENALDLEKVAPKLAALGLPLRAWLLERNEHLYNYGGFETYEPIFDKAYLKRVAAGMHDLWCGTMDLRPISYEYLAAELRETDLYRIKTAVRRIGIVGRYRLSDSDAPRGVVFTGESDFSRPTIRHTLSGWSWLKNSLSLNAVCKRIESLKDPRDYLHPEPIGRIIPANRDQEIVEATDDIKLGMPLDQLFNSACSWPFAAANTDNGNEDIRGRNGDPKKRYLNLQKIHGALRRPSRQNPGTGNIVILGKAGTGKSTLAMQIAAEAVLRNKGVYAAYFSLEETRAHIFSKAEKFGWTQLLVPANVPQDEAYSRDIATLSKELGEALDGHCCRAEDGKPNPAVCSQNPCEFKAFCQNLVNRGKHSKTKKSVLLPKMLPFSFGEQYRAEDSDKLFHDRFQQIKAFLDAAVELRNASQGEKDVRIVCVDSLNVLGRGGMTRDHLSSLFDLFKRHNVIGVFVLEDAARGVFAGQSELDQETIEFLADMTIELTGREEDGYWVRHFQIKKSRYQQHVLGRHPFKIRSVRHDDDTQKNRDNSNNKTHPDKSITGLHIFPSTHHINAVLSSAERKNKPPREQPTGPTKSSKVAQKQVWTNNTLDEHFIPEDPERDTAHSIFTIVGPATSGKSILAINYLLQGLESETGHSLLIRLTCDDEDKQLDTFYFPPEKKEAARKKKKTLHSKEPKNPFDGFTKSSVADKTLIKTYLDAIDHSKYSCNVYARGPVTRNTPLLISLALKSGFLLPEEFFEAVLLLFEWASIHTVKKIERVVLYDVSAIGHSYPLLRNSSTDCDLFLSSLVQFFRFKRTGFMMCATRSGVPESETVVEKVISLADFVIESNHLDVFGDRYITYTGPGAVDRELKSTEPRAHESVPGVLRKNEEFACYQVDFKPLEGFVGFSSGNIRRPGVSLYMFQEKELQQRYNMHVQKMLRWALAAPSGGPQTVGQQFYPDVQFKPFDSKESEAFHNGLDLLQSHPLHRTVIRTIDEFAINVICDKSGTLTKAHSNHDIYYKNVLVLLVSKDVAEKHADSKTISWENLADYATAHLQIHSRFVSCYYDASAHETLVAGMLDALTVRTGRHDEVARITRKPEKTFEYALHYFQRAEPLDYMSFIGKKTNFIILCWYTQARYLLSEMQKRKVDLARDLRMFALPHGGFRGDWYLWVAPDSVSPSLGNQIKEKMLSGGEQMKRFLDGVGLPAWHRFLSTDVYFEKFHGELDERIRAVCDAAGHSKKNMGLCKRALDTLAKAYMANPKRRVPTTFSALPQNSGLSEKYSALPAYINSSKISSVPKVSSLDLNMPAFPGAAQNVRDILNIHADAKKRSEIAPNASGRKYKDIHAQLYAIIREMIDAPSAPSTEELKAKMNNILELCGLPVVP